MKARTSLAAVIAALLVPAAATAAPVKAAARAAPRSATAGQPLQGLSMGGFVGYENDDIDGLSLRFDGELPFRALSPQVNLSWVGSLGYSRLSIDDFDFNIVKLIPAARFSLPLNPQFTLFGDAGLGLYYASYKVAGVEQIPTFPFFRPVERDESELHLIMRIGAGAWYFLNEQTRIGAMLEFDPYFGDIDQTTFILQVGAMFRL